MLSEQLGETADAFLGKMKKRSPMPIIDFPVEYSNMADGRH